ncbi:MAG TPA: ABC transporter substrate-binding protein [Candidatus Binatia bacterium]|nr:ABC transporter substrate-binding protein [Candidatus Binatia bacterium]
MMKSILFWLLATVFLTTAPTADAQQSGKIFRLGFLDSSTASSMAGLLEAFRQELRKLGWIEGKNITIEFRFAEQKQERLPELATELVRLKVDLMVIAGTGAALAAKNATTTIPIVMANAGDPVGAGLVASLARPGGNVTGLHGLGPELNTKRLEVLKDAVPKLTRVGLLLAPGSGIGRDLQLKELRPAAQALKLKTGGDRDSTRRQRFRARLSNRKAETGQSDDDDDHPSLFRRKKADRRACRQIPIAGYLL